MQHVGHRPRIEGEPLVGPDRQVAAVEAAPVEAGQQAMSARNSGAESTTRAAMARPSPAASM